MAPNRPSPSWGPSSWTRPSTPSLISGVTLIIGVVVGALLQQVTLLQPISTQKHGRGESTPSFEGQDGIPYFSDSTVKCQRHTKAGLCITDIFGAIDDAYRHLWPGTVDLLLRSYVSDKFFLMKTLFNSIDLMWPKGIGDVVLVLDVGDTTAASLVPDWVKIYYEENYLKLPGKFLQQWSYAWAELYTTADYVAIIDDDCVFNMKVTPGLLFNLTDKRPYMIGSNRHQRNVWAQWSEFLVGKHKYFANFMVQLPFIAPRDMFPKFREHVARVHPQEGSYDRAFKWKSLHAKKFGRDQIQHAAFGNYMYHFMRDKIHLALEWTKHVPIPRVSVHVPWTILFYKGSDNGLIQDKVVDLFPNVAAHYAMDGLCHSFPEGELAGCEGMKVVQNQVWIYAYDWADWPLIYENDTSVYDRHVRELHCMYGKLVELYRARKWNTKKTKRSCVTDTLRTCISKEMT